MQDRERYHESAVEYNEKMAIAAEELVDYLQDPVVKKWCVGIGKQHRFHLKRHRAALAKIRGKRIVEGNIELRSLSLDPEPNAFGGTVHLVEKTVAEEQAEFAAQQETAEDDIVLEGKD